MSRENIRSLNKLVIIGAHDESAGVVLGALGGVRRSSPVLADVYPSSSCVRCRAVLNRKLQLVLVHRRRIHRVITEGEGLGLGKLGWAGVEAVTQLSTFLAKVWSGATRGGELCLSEGLLLLSEEAVISVSGGPGHAAPVHPRDDLEAALRGGHAELPGEGAQLLVAHVAHLLLLLGL